MDGGFKAYVRLGDVRPSESNPRKDFGDIAALARSIEATGGEPINPMVLVRDGNVYRIVDGERRYRALCQIHGEDERVGALVFNDSSAAGELVAMLATDDKLRLSAAEQAQGFQQMMVLGVDEDLAAKAVGRDVDQVRRARRALRGLEGVEQTTLDAMIAAGDDEFSDDERLEIINAGEAHAESRAAEIRRNHKALQNPEPLKREGIEYHGETLKEPEGWAHVATCLNAKEADAVDVPEGGTLHAWWNHAYPAPSGWSIYREMTEDELAQRTEKDEQEEREAAERRRQVDLCRVANEEMMGWLLDSITDDSLVDSLPATCAAAIKDRNSIGADRYGMDEIMVSREGDVAGSAPSWYEVVAWLDRHAFRLNSWYSTPFYCRNNSWDHECERNAQAWDTLVADGWQPPERILEVREACERPKK